MASLSFNLGFNCERNVSMLVLPHIVICWYEMFQYAKGNIVSIGTIKKGEFDVIDILWRHA